jgi:deoxyuridine 5'-triphosphate nucleotidohydrolase
MTSPNLTLCYKRLSNNATEPTLGTPDSAGYDLYAAESIVIDKVNINDAGEIIISKECVKTDLAIAIPSRYYGHICNRSSVSWKKNVHTGAGIIDSDYRGNVGVVLYNLSNVPFVIMKGDRIAQLIVKRRETVDFVEVTNELPETQRGRGGFGSTGV